MTQQLLDLIPLLPEHVRDKIYELVEDNNHNKPTQKTCHLRKLYDIYPQDINRYLLTKYQHSIMNIYEDSHHYKTLNTSEMKVLMIVSLVIVTMIKILKYLYNYLHQR